MQGLDKLLTGFIGQSKIEDIELKFKEQLSKGITVDNEDTTRVDSNSGRINHLIMLYSGLGKICYPIS